jgi:ribosomal subunit interface protein
MKHSIEFKSFSPNHRLREQVEEWIAHIDRHAPNFPADAVFLRLFIEENARRKLYHVSLTCDLPGRTLAAQEERHDVMEAVRAAFAEIERQIEKHKEMLSGSYLYKRPARREALRREKAEVIPDGEREHELFSTIVERHLENLYNFACRELTHYQATGDLLPGELTAEDVVDGTLLRAHRELVKKPAGRRIRSWLIQLATEQLEGEIKRQKSERTRTVHIEEDIPETPPTEEVSTLGDEILDFYQPDEDLKLEDIIPDMEVPTPEQILESRDLQRYINRTLTTLPRVWRRVFVLHYVEGLPAAEIARMIKQPKPVVERYLEYTREYLRQQLIEAGFETPTHDQAGLAIFGTTADIEVPAVFRNAVIEKYKKLEETGDD